MPDIIQTCGISGERFTITEKDQLFYKKMEIPLPTLSPDERMRRRLSYRNERHFHSRSCDLCNKSIIAIYPESVNFPVYCPDCWWSDKWDALNYGRDFDFTRPFFDQYKELQQEVPRISMVLVNVENSPFCNFTGDLKNCYLCFGSIYAEDCFYGNPYYSKNSVDILVSRECELAYECIDCSKIYQSSFCQNSKNCSDSWFLKDCIGCDHCIGCVNLRNKSYYYFNESLSKEAWEEKIKKLDFGKHSTIIETKEKFSNFLKQCLHKSLHITQCEDSLGDHIIQCKDTYNSFFSKNLEGCSHMTQTIDMENSYDSNYMENSKWVVDSFGAYRNYNLRFGNTVYESSDCDYCDFCVNNMKNCFGCISLKKKQYCILNKQYTQEEYENIVPKIIEHMTREPFGSGQEGAGSAMNPSETSGSWGEFFPSILSPFPYNESVAHEYYPLTKEEALQRGLKWREKDNKNYTPQECSIPDDIRDVSTDICNQILTCESTGKNYKIIPQELMFYKKMGLPIPRKCPDQRHQDRLSLRNPRKLYNRQCMKCEKNIETTHNPNKSELVYCEDCYLEEIY